MKMTSLPETVQQSVTHILMSIAPGKEEEPAQHLFPAIRTFPHLRWIGYLSSTNVYGNHNGGWVDEDTQTTPSLERGRRRVTSENLWWQLAQDAGQNTDQNTGQNTDQNIGQNTEQKTGVACHIFRLAGIYGPGRNALTSLQSGKAKRIIKKGQLFSRIHVDDIAQTVLCGMESRLGSRIFNVADDMPAPPQDVITHAASLMEVTPPSEVAFEDADLSPMAASFYQESKRVRNDRIKDELGVKLLYPDYKTGLQHLLKDM